MSEPLDALLRAVAPITYGQGGWAVSSQKFNFIMRANRAALYPVTLLGWLSRFCWRTAEGTGTFNVELIDEYEVDHLAGKLRELPLGAGSGNVVELSALDSDSGALQRLVVPGGLNLKVTSSSEATLRGCFTFYGRLQ